MTEQFLFSLNVEICKYCAADDWAISVFTSMFLNVFWCRCVEMGRLYGKGLTLSHIQQICSRLLWKHTHKNMETFFKWKYNYKIVLKKLWQMEKLFMMSNFSICQDVFRSRLLQRWQKASVCLKGFKNIWNITLKIDDLTLLLIYW